MVLGILDQVFFKNFLKVLVTWILKWLLHSYICCTNLCLD